MKLKWNEVAAVGMNVGLLKMLSFWPKSQDVGQEEATQHYEGECLQGETGCNKESLSCARESSEHLVLVMGLSWESYIPAVRTGGSQGAPNTLTPCARSWNWGQEAVLAHPQERVRRSFRALPEPMQAPPTWGWPHISKLQFSHPRRGPTQPYTSQGCYECSSRGNTKKTHLTHENN